MRLSAGAGTFTVAGTGINAAVEEVLRLRSDGGFHPGRPEGWDGRASERIVALLADA